MQQLQDSSVALTFHPATLILQLLSGNASDGCLKSFQNIASKRFLKKRPGSYLYGKGRSVNYHRLLTGLWVGKPEGVSTPRAGPSALVSGWSQWGITIKGLQAPEDTRIWNKEAWPIQPSANEELQMNAAYSYWERMCQALIRLIEKISENSLFSGKGSILLLLLLLLSRISHVRLCVTP